MQLVAKLDERDAALWLVKRHLDLDDAGYAGCTMDGGEGGGKKKGKKVRKQLYPV